MPRKNIIVSSQFPYHITARVNNREKFPGDMQSIWKILTSELHLQSIRHKTEIHAFVLMPNHYHLLASSPRGNISSALRDFQSSSTRIINTKYQRWGRVYGGRYHWSIISSPKYFSRVLKYIYRNPMKAKLCESIADYPYSTAHGILGYSALPLPLTLPHREIAFQIPEDLLSLETWLNKPHSHEENSLIKVSLRRKIFKPAVKRSNRRPQLMSDN